LARPCAVGSGKTAVGAAGAGPGILAVLKSLPVTARPRIPKPDSGAGKLHVIYHQSPAAPEDAVGVSFNFRPVPLGDYHWIEVTISAITIAGFPTDQDAIDAVKANLPARILHEEAHITVAVQVAIAVQRNPVFQQMGPRGMKDAARKIETHVN